MKQSYMFVILASLGVLFIFSYVTTNVSANDQIVICRGETLQISARLLTNGTYGDPAPYQVIEFFDETNNCFINLTLTDLDGYAIIDWYLPLDYKLGLTIVNATFRGNETCALSPSYQQVFILIQASTYFHIQVDKENLTPGDQLSFTILLTDDNSNPLSNESVDVLCDDIFLISGETNVSGHIRFVINCNQSWGNLGSNTITVAYLGNSQEFYAVSEMFFLININKIETIIELDNEFPHNFELNDSLELDLILEANNVPLRNATVEVYLDNRKFIDLITNGSGMGLLSFNVDDNFYLGLHELMFEYGGTERYDSTFLVFDFTVISPVITKVESLTNCIIGKNSTVRVYLFDILGRPIQNVSAKLTDSMTNQSYTQQFHLDANFTDFQIQIKEPKGARNYSIEVIGNEFISNITNSFSLLIWTQPIISVINTNIKSYASPSQIITFEFKISDYSNNYSNRVIWISLNNGLINFSTITDYFGVKIVNLSAPVQEEGYEISIIFKGNESAYELPAHALYLFHVTRIMPVIVELQQYSVIPSLQQLKLDLKIVALNGSALDGIGFSYEWLDMTGYILSSHGGFISLSLLVPSEEGLYVFLYQILQSNSIQSSSGSIIIAVNKWDAASSQGVGILSIAVSIGMSLGIVSIPRIIRRRMIGL